MAVTTSALVGETIGERPSRRKFRLKPRGAKIMAMRGGRKKKKKNSRGGTRRK